MEIRQLEYTGRTYAQAGAEAPCSLFPALIRTRLCRILTHFPVSLEVSFEISNSLPSDLNIEG